METKEKKVYQAMLVVCALIIGLLMICVDVNARKADKHEQELAQKEHYYELGNALENYILDVVFETDILDDISEEESEYLEYLIDEGMIGTYYIKLIELCEKYYGNKD